MKSVSALLAKARAASTCRNIRIGSVIETPSGEHILGWNGPPSRAGKHGRCLLGGPITPENMRQCPGVHAEVRAVCRAAEAGVSVTGATMYLSEWFPCAPCAVVMIEAGISRLVVADEFKFIKDECYNFALARECLKKAGVVVEERRDLSPRGLGAKRAGRRGGMRPRPVARKRKKRVPGLAAAVLLLVALCCHSLLPMRIYAASETGESLSPTPRQDAAAESSSGIMRIYMIDVGQGDSALVIFPDTRTMLIDAGERWAAPAVLDLLGRLGIGALDFLVASHYHPDHTGGFAEVVARGHADSCTKAYALADGSWAGMTWHAVSPGDVLCAGGGAAATCCAAGGRIIGGTYVDPGNNRNAKSIVLDIKYKGFDYLTGGDLTGSGHNPDVEDPLGDALAARGINIDVYKVHHHGSRFSSNLYFLKKIMPEFALVSVGDRNKFGHPTRAAIRRLNDPDVHVERIFQTETGRRVAAPNVTVAHGQIVVATDGLSYTFANEGPGSEAFSCGPYPVDERVYAWPMFSQVASASPMAEAATVSWSCAPGGAGNTNPAGLDDDIDTDTPAYLGSFGNMPSTSFHGNP